MLDIRRLVLLRDLAEYGTVTGVAEIHHVTASAVSQQLRQLEEETATVLLHREGRRIRLTAAGRALAEDAAAVVTALDRAEANLRQRTESVSGPLHLSCFTSALAPLAAPLLALARERFPDLAVQVAEAEPEESLPRLRRHGTDLALVYDYPSLQRPPATGVQTTPLITEPLLAAVPHGHPHARDPDQEIALEQLADLPWVVGAPGSDCRETVLHACRIAGFTPRIAAECADFTSALAVASAARAAVLVPRMAMPRPPAGTAGLRVRAAHLVRTVGVATRKGTEADPRLQAVLALTRTLAGDHR